jgi:hypothetical protein
MQVTLGGEVTFAFKKAGKPGLVYAVQELDSTSDNLASLLQSPQYTTSNIIQVYERYCFQGTTFLMQECMDVSLAEVIACPLKLEEHHIATTCLEVCPPKRRARQCH